MASRKLDECWISLGIVGGEVGIIVGAVLGFFIAGVPGSIAGGVLGASAGFLTGAGLGGFLCWLFHRDKESWSHAKPRFSSISLHARDNPTTEDTNCSLTIQYQVDGNTDRALCEITFEIEAEAATPGQAPPLPAVRNNASSFGRHTYPFMTQWADPHDGRVVKGTITLVATKDGQTYSITEEVTAIRVPVLPR